MTEPYDCENCEHYVRITDGRTAKDRICIFDGECEHLPMTNEEYLKSCDTEQLAETIAQYFYGWTTNSTPYDIILHSVVEWLKQPHQ